METKANKIEQYDKSMNAMTAVFFVAFGLFLACGITFVSIFVK